MSTSRIKKYISVFNIGLQNTFVYRWNYFLRALFGLIPLAGTVFLWSAVFKERGGALHGYDYGSMIYYYLLTLLVSNLVVPTEDEWQIAADIREGQINALLTKPMSYLGYRFSIFLSGRLVYSFVTLPPIALIFVYFRDYIVLPTDPVIYVFTTVSILMAAFIQFFITYSLAIVRIFPGRPDVSHRYHAVRGPSRHEMAAVLLRVVLPGRDLSRPIKRSRPYSRAGDASGLVVPHVVLGKLYVETWPRPLPSRGRISAANFFDSRVGESLLRSTRGGRGGEFLEARILPERIEHWIEPEQRGSERVSNSCLNLWR